MTEPRTPLYVITSHWSHPINDDLPYFIYRHELNAVDDKLGVGDRVLFYEAEHRNGVREATRVVNGIRTPSVPLRQASRGIIRAGYVTGPRRRIEPSDVVYDYGDRGDVERWEWLTPCKFMLSGDIPYKTVTEILGSNVPAYTFGLKEIKPEQYAALEALLWNQL